RGHERGGAAAEARERRLDVDDAAARELALVRSALGEQHAQRRLMRILPTGSKTFWFQYRPRGGGYARIIRIDTARALGLQVGGGVAAAGNLAGVAARHLAGSGDRELGMSAVRVALQVSRRAAR